MLQKSERGLSTFDESERWRPATCESRQQRCDSANNSTCCFSTISNAVCEKEAVLQLRLRVL